MLDRCLAVRPGEQVMLLTDDGTDGDVVERLVAGIEARRGMPVVSRIPMPPLPGSEPPEHGRRGHARGRRRHRADEPVHRFEPGPPRGDRRRACATWRCRVCGSRRSATTGRSRSTSMRSAATPSGSATRWGEASTFRLTTPAGTDLRGSVQGRPGTGAARPGARGRRLHGAAGHRGGHGARRGLERGRPS